MARRIGNEVLRWVPSDLRARFQAAVEERDWGGALRCAATDSSLSLCMELFLGGVIPEDEWAGVLAEAISRDEAPARERLMLDACLTRLVMEGQRVFDGEAARAAFAGLPRHVTIYRGTTAAEETKYGVCWTLDRDQAAVFATRHSQTSTRSSTPVVLAATVDREDICGLLFEQERKDVLVSPRNLQNVCCACP